MYLCIYIATHQHMVYLEWLQAVRESNSRFAWKWRSSELRDTLRGHNWASLGMYFQAVVERVGTYTWRLRSSEFGDAHGGRDRASLEIHLEDVIEWNWRCNLRLRSREFGDALGGHDRANLEAVIERVWRCTWRLWWSEFRDTHQHNVIVSGSHIQSSQTLWATSPVLLSSSRCS